MAKEVLVDERSQAKLFTTLVTWHHAPGVDGHCLSQLIVPAEPGPAVMVLSELASDPDPHGITGHFDVAATAAFNVVQPYTTINPYNTHWFAHHGPFSSYDPTGAATLTRVTLSYDGERYHGDLAGHHLLSGRETEQLITSWGLESVPRALARLGHRD
ncbi:hypothetical protein AB0K09_02605 [Streptomyces sp. NPDC049577]|uniref:hypothetical protein n=1 Tax=Streptomyces sp. NPDC049577 TaxID=3155153 RepID=UPI00344811AE